MQRKMTVRNLIFLASIILFLGVVFGITVFASNTDGTIDSTYKYVWGENIGWVNFAATNGNVHVTDSGLSGYALGENTGWIYLGDVVNDGNGNLSGLAWGENIGWIKFDPTNGGVIINSSGEFTGSALGENVGWIIFDGDYTVKTDWRPQSARPSSGGGSSGSRPTWGVTQNLTANVVDGLTSVIDSFIPDFLKKKPEVVSTAQPSQEESLSFVNSWDYLDASLVKNFIFAPLPSELAIFIKKYPELGKIFTKLGVRTIADLDRLKGAVVSLPSIANLKDLPREVVIAKSGMGKIDVISSITLDETGKVEQKIETTSSTTLTLAVKPSGLVNSVNGYLIFKESAKKTVAEMSFNLQTASAILAFQNVSNRKLIIPEKELLVQTFSYEDSNHDGIYTANIKTPAVEGTYEVITLINYTDKSLGTKELRLVTVVDPEGYVYYQNSNGDEARVSKAVISIFNADTNTLWDAISYNQTNPQTTDTSGKYSFLVPEGKYYITANRNGYQSYKSAIFEVREGRGVHFNIELQGSGWFAKLSWTTVFLSLIILILGSIFSGYVVHEHALKKKLMKHT